jgi:NtrC-family two-component system sensor histidine kinase KinB
MKKHNRDLNLTAELVSLDSDRKHYLALIRLTPFVIFGVTLVIMLTHIPTMEDWANYHTSALVYSVLVAFTLYFAVWLSYGTLSPVYVIGMIAFLSMPPDAISIMIWFLTIGTLIGAVSVLTQGHHRIEIGFPNYAVNLMMLVSRVVISYFFAGQIFLSLGGVLPLDRGIWYNNQQLMIAVLIYIVMYLFFYVAIYVLSLYTRYLRVVEIILENRVMIIAVLFVPLPFAVIVAELAGGFSHPMVIIALSALMVSIIGLHALSRSEHQTRRQLDEVTTLAVVTRSMRAHLETDGLLRTIYIQVSSLFDVSDFTLIVYNRNLLSQALIIRNGEELAGTTALHELEDEKLLQRVITTTQSLTLQDQKSVQAHVKEAQFPFYIWLGVPLVIGGEGVGVLSLASRTVGRMFSSNDIRLLTIIADSVSIALENAVLFEQQVERVAQLSKLNKISTVLSNTLSAETLPATVLRSALLLDDDAFASVLYLYPVSGKEQQKLDIYVLGVGQSFVDLKPEPVSLGEDHKLQTAEIITVSNIMTDERTETLRDLLGQEGVQSLAEIPFVMNGRPIGVLALLYQHQQNFNDEMLELFRAFGTQSALAIHNAWTYTTTDKAFQRSTEQLVTLAMLGRSLTSTIDLNLICELVLHRVIESTFASAGAVLLECDAHHERVAVYQARDGEALVDVSVVDGGITQQAYRMGKAMYLDATNPIWGIENPRLVAISRSQLAMPISRGRDVLGVILVESQKINGFSAEDTHFIEQVANQAVIAIENARLFKRITEARDRLQVILDTMEEAIILIDRDGVIALANPRISLLDLMPHDLVDLHVNDVFQDSMVVSSMGFKDAEDVLQIIRDIGVENAWPSHPPYLYVLPANDGGRRYIQRFIIPVLDESAQTMGVLLVFYDKTDEQEINRTREELTRMIVHDLRSPLTAVTTGLKLLQDYIPATNEAYTLIQSTTQTSRQAVRKLLARVDSLLDIAKMQSGRMAIDRSPVIFSEVMQTVQKELEPLAKELEMIDESSPDLPVVSIDRDKVERLLLNLVDNALKYSPTEDKIMIRATQIDDGHIEVRVIDHGPGVPDDYKKALFDSFVQVEGREKVRRGVGLGLSFCKMVTEAHGGSIWVEDNQPNGSIFVFTLPIDGKDIETDLDDLNLDDLSEQLQGL